MCLHTSTLTNLLLPPSPGTLERHVAARARPPRALKLSSLLSSTTLLVIGRKNDSSTRAPPPTPPQFPQFPQFWIRVERGTGDAHSAPSLPRCPQSPERRGGAGRRCGSMGEGNVVARVLKLAPTLTTRLTASREAAPCRRRSRGGAGRRLHYMRGAARRREGRPRPRAPR